ncbi:D-beta-D-heptose 1-phosphate adenylyltransferase / D-beta-D-heptose 7-phosphate kinase [Candidatus Methylobacter favarea]|uniref:D-beta-D-heptose 1-phosphate adenylyltransferase / D-beta-D-heptose 7-phosphate kinase n=1 Tax=Candidatus Methylobacter favarea TaxID=2707345 RepID=A0A8S0XLL2_9GAMM|nr:PfkB family carbohydrate kinase [Candidatus Methylobacter favarea]CAA9892862.1 D-beta-D-heptose 1-phosphate adenylyltransferase / D-beta-D-heptose 7-phosphate kinase [Candidatus Methylobacter favarea]
MNDKYLATINRFEGLNVLVIGDAMLDVYWDGAANRICREAPVPIVDIKNVKAVPGGAANTAVNLVQLGADVHYLSIMGCDHEADLLKDALMRHGLDLSLIISDPTRQTLTKQRVAAGSQLLVRFDAGTTRAIDRNYERRIIAILKNKFHKVDAVIVSDYGYGLMTDNIIGALKSLQHKKETILVIDAKSLDKYSHIGATVAKPNYQELVTLLAITEPAANGHRHEQLKRYGPELLKKTGTAYVAATIDIEGALLFQHGKAPYRTFSKPVENSKAAGAGDTYVSALTLALASGASIEVAGEIAQCAAIVILQKSATATCTRNELSHYFGSSSKYTPDWQELKGRLEAFKKEGKRIVFTNGCFDLLQGGHVAYLEQARALGDVLILGLNSDAGIKRLKGSNRPANSLHERIRILAGLEAVTLVTTFEEDTPINLLNIIQPDVYAKGSGYSIENLPNEPVIPGYSEAVEISFLAGIDARQTALPQLKN